MGRTAKYYPSSLFSPSVALGALLTRNWGSAPNERKHLTPSDKKLGLALGKVSVVKVNHSGLYVNVLSPSGFFCVAPYLTASDNKLGRASNGCYACF